MVWERAGGREAILGPQPLGQAVLRAGEMERKRETAGGIWKAVAKSRLGEEEGVNKDLEEFSS